MKLLKEKTILLYLILLIASCGPEKTENGYTILWEENFEDSTKLEANWSKIPRGENDWNIYMSDHNGLYGVKSGKLILKGVKNTLLPEDDAPYLTAGVYTKGKRTFGYGRLEINAQLIGARGAWPAIWLLPKDQEWPHGGEIDIMHRLNNDNLIYQTIHSTYTVDQGIKNTPKSSIAAHINPDNYNVYAVELYPDSIRFFVNDTHTFTYPRIETEKSGQFPFSDNEFYLLIDMQLGGSWAGNVNEQDLPTEMHIDWVRFIDLEK